MNTVRIPIVMEAILGKRYGHTNSKPLQGYSILDIGCGGGILSEVIYNYIIIVLYCKFVVISSFRG